MNVKQAFEKSYELYKRGIKHSVGKKSGQWVVVIKGVK